MASGYTEVEGGTGRRGVCARLSRTFCYEPERPAHKNELKVRELGKHAGCTFARTLLMPLRD